MNDQTQIDRQAQMLADIKVKLSIIDKEPTDDELRQCFGKLNTTAVQRGFKTLDSDKAMRWLNRRGFVTEVTPNKSIAYSFWVDFENKKKSSILMYYWHTIKTAGGLVYVLSSEKVCYCFTAHLFDRINERQKLSGSRADMIRDFAKAVVTGLACVHSPVIKNGSASWFAYEGLCIGVPGDGFVLFKTYVTVDMLRDSQEGMFDKLICDCVDKFVLLPEYREDAIKELTEYSLQKAINSKFRK